VRILLEEKIEVKRLSWSLIESNFYTTDEYLNELGLDEELKKEIKNE